MAGSCTGLGVRINRNNEVEAAVDRKEAWPYPGSAATKSGTRVDPVTKLLWTPPDSVVKVAEAPLGPNKVVSPPDTDTIRLTDLSLEMVASKDHDQVMFSFSLSGGYVGFRLGAGNFWAVYRYVTTYLNGVPTTFSDWEEVAGAENNASGAIGSSTVPDSFEGWKVVAGGVKFKVVARYELRPLAFTDRAVNSMAWRPPRLQIMQWSMDTPATTVTTEVVG
jgi:hypothetical protein